MKPLSDSVYLAAPRTSIATRDENQTPATKHTPILFSAPMVRAVLAGTKTQTRRAAKFVALEPGLNFDFTGLRAAQDRPGGWTLQSRDGATNLNDRTKVLRCPYGIPGDRLWVRETTRMCYFENFLTGEPTNAECGEYVADGEPVLDPCEFDYAWWYSRKTCPAIHMPRWASRITLEVTGVRVEHLHSISDKDAIAEGLERNDDGWRAYDSQSDQIYLAASDSYRSLWESINGPGSWAANPFVWVIEFRRLAKGEIPATAKGEA